MCHRNARLTPSEARGESAPVGNAAHREDRDRRARRRRPPPAPARYCRTSRRMTAGSRPCAMMMSDRSAASFACPSVCTWQMILCPTALMRPRESLGSPNEASPPRAPHRAPRRVQREPVKRPEDEADADARVARLAQFLRIAAVWRSPSRPGRARRHAEPRRARAGGRIPSGPAGWMLESRAAGSKPCRYRLSPCHELDSS